MTRRTIFSAGAVTLFLLLGALHGGLWAQGVWLDHGRETSLSIEFLKPFLDSDDYSFMTTAWFVTGRMPLTDRVVMVVEQPFTHAGSDRYSISQIAFGNTYPGVEVFRDGSQSSVELGFRPPIASEDDIVASFLGLATDFDRAESFYPSGFHRRVEDRRIPSGPASQDPSRREFHKRCRPRPGAEPGGEFRLMMQ